VDVVGFVIIMSPRWGWMGGCSGVVTIMLPRWGWVGGCSGVVTIVLPRWGWVGGCSGGCYNNVTPLGLDGRM